MKKRFTKLGTTGIFILGLIACVFSCGRFNIPVLGWIWPACLLFAFRTFRTRRAELLAGLVFLLAQTLRYWGYTGAGVAGDALIGAVIGLTVLVPLMLDRMVYLRLKNRCTACAILFAPFVFTAVVMMTDLFISMPQLAYSQGENLPLVQASAIIGSYGVSFLLTLFGSAAAYMLAERKHRPLCVCTLVLLAIFVLGGARLAFTPTRGDGIVRMATALSPIEGDFLEDTLVSPDYEGNMTFLNEKAATARAAGAEVLCFAEEAFEYEDVEEEKYIDAVSAIARETGINILFPVDVADTDGSTHGRSENKEFLFDREGKLVATYYKTNLLPGMLEADSYVAGDGSILYAELPTSDGRTVNVASVICFDSNNPRFVTGIDDRTDVLLLPSWCWDGCDAYEATALSFRAVENNVALVTPCVDAKSTTYDWTGSIVCRTDAATTGRDGITFTNVPVRSESTRAPYHFISVWLDWIYLAGTVLLAIYTVISVRRKKEE